MSVAMDSLLDHAARLDPAEFALGGHVPTSAFAPRTAEEVAEVLRACAVEGLVARPWGGGVHQTPALGAAAPRYDVALSLRHFDGVVSHEPGDLTCVLGAGLNLARAARALAAHRQELPLESAHAHRATVGGVCASDASGPRRMRLGAPRHRVLGMRFVTGDGLIARSGGRVVKNVAGYGTHRLLCGSRGGLAVILEASFKLLPAPERRVGLLFDLTHERLADQLRSIRLSRLDPSVLSVLDPEGARGAGLAAPIRGWIVIVGLEADAPWVAEEEGLAASLLGEPRERFMDDEAVELWQALADLESPGGDSMLEAAVLPSEVAGGLRVLADAGAKSVWAHVESGALRARLATGSEDRALQGVRAAGGRFAESAEAGGSGSDSVVEALRQRLRQAFDPRGTLSGGRET